jgi:hypothetical protein
MVVGSWALILPNWTDKMQAAPSLSHTVKQSGCCRYDDRAMPFSMTTTSSRTPLFPRLRLSAHAKIILRMRYLAKNAAGTIIETPAQLFWRAATDIAQTERLYPAALRIPVEACS